MMLLVYSVRDRAVQAFMTPFFARTDAEATRSFRDACSTEGHQFNKHLVDFALYRVGQFDDAQGVLVALEQPDRIVTGEAIANEVATPF